MLKRYLISASVASSGFLSRSPERRVQWIKFRELCLHLVGSQARFGVANSALVDYRNERLALVAVGMTTVDLLEAVQRNLAGRELSDKNTQLMPKVLGKLLATREN